MTGNQLPGGADYYWPTQSRVDLSKCWCKCGSHVSEPVTADFWWLTLAGNWVGLCDACCMGWRANAVKEPDLQAVRITSRWPL